MVACTPPKTPSEVPATGDLPTDTFTVEGLWVLPHFVDSTVINRSIGRYRMHYPVWFAIFLDVGKETVRAHGSIMDDEVPIDPHGDTLCVFSKTVSGKWCLISKGKSLELHHLDTSRQGQKVYALEKRTDLAYLLEEQQKVHKTDSAITRYFHEKILVGSYQLVGTEDRVIFETNGRISGFQDFISYEVDSYYGTLHPYGNLDNLMFYRDVEPDFGVDNWELYQWEFSGDTLVLTPFEWQMSTYRGKPVRDEMWNLSKSRIKLVKE